MTLYKYEENLLAKGYKYIAGCDEAGRGPIAGPVVAAAVILNPLDKIAGLDDSKKLTAKKRDMLKKEIEKRAIAYAVSFVFEREIDEINILEASRKAMYLALEKLNTKYDFVLSDAVELPNLNTSYLSIIKGDQKSASIAAASILAKQARDLYMEKMDKLYPGYLFSKHKGYPTKKHLMLIKEKGICAIHRKSYAPVRSIIEKQISLDI